jgi:hypothetical protein
LNESNQPRIVVLLSRLGLGRSDLLRLLPFGVLQLTLQAGDFLGTLAGAGLRTGDALRNGEAVVLVRADFGLITATLFVAVGLVVAVVFANGTLGRGGGFIWCIHNNCYFIYVIDSISQTEDVKSISNLFLSPSLVRAPACEKNHLISLRDMRWGK